MVREGLELKSTKTRRFTTPRNVTRTLLPLYLVPPRGHVGAAGGLLPLRLGLSSWKRAARVISAIISALRCQLVRLLVRSRLDADADVDGLRHVRRAGVLPSRAAHERGECGGGRRAPCVASVGWRRARGWRAHEGPGRAWVAMHRFAPPPAAALRHGQRVRAARGPARPARRAVSRAP